MRARGNCLGAVGSQSFSGFVCVLRGPPNINQRPPALHDDPNVGRQPERVCTDSKRRENLRVHVLKTDEKHSEDVK